MPDSLLWQRYHRIIFYAIGFLLIFNLLAMGRVPEIPHADDGGYAAAAYQFWRTGHPGVPGYRDIVGLDQDIFAFGRTAAAFQGLFMWIAGVSLLAAMLPSYLAGIGLLAVTYGLARSLWDREHALLAMGILGFSGIFFSASRAARPDLLLALAFVGALLLMASGSREVFSWHYPLAGVVMGVSGDLHINGFLLAPVPLVFWLTLRRETLRLRVQIILIYSIGVLWGVAFWLAVHYWPNPESFMKQIAIFGEKTHGIRIANLGLLGAIHGEVQRYLSWFWWAKLHRHLFEGLIILGCGLGVIIWGGRKERALFVAWLSVFWISVFFMANPSGWYLIYVWPIFALWVARGFFAAYQTRAKRWAVTALCILFAGYLGNLALWTGKAFSGPSYTVISQELRSMIHQEASVVAGGEWWFALYGRDFTDAQHNQFQALLAKEKGEAMPSSWEYAWRRWRWNYAVAYGDIQAMLDTEVPLEQALSSIGIWREREIREVRAFAINHCRVLKRIRTAYTPVLILEIK